MDKNRLPDTPWHVGFVKKEEQDPRRHKARCIHIKAGKCNYGKSGCFTMKCVGSAHCSYYAESLEQWKKVYLQTRTAEEEEAVTHRNAIQIINSLNRDEYFETEDVNGDEVCRFSGVESIRLKEICLPNEYREWKPDKKEVQKLLEYYEEYRKLPEPIVIEIREGKYCLKDKFIYYYVSKRLKKKWIRATMNIQRKGRHKNKK